MSDLFLYAAGIGLAFNAAPGAVFAESLRRGLHGGFRPAFGVQVGSLVGDATWAVLGLSGVGAIFLIAAIRLPISVAGALVLMWLGWQALRDARSAALPDVAASAGGTGRALSAGAALSLGNPWNVIYWSGAAGTVASVIGAAPSWPQLGTFFAGFMLSSVLWCFVCAGMIAFARRFLSNTLVRALDLASGLSLIAMGGWALLRAVA